MGDTLVIPYPSNKEDEEIINSMLFGFGIVIGSMIRCGLVQNIQFQEYTRCMKKLKTNIQESSHLHKSMIQYQLKK